MKVLFLDGLGSNPGGFKPTFLRGQGFEVVYPVLPELDFEDAVAVAQRAWSENAPDVIVGYSRGGALAMALGVDAPLVLIAPAWKRRFDMPPRLPGPTVVLHSQADDGVPLEGSRELLRHNGLPESALVVVGADHTMIDADALRTMLDAVRAITMR